MTRPAAYVTDTFLSVIDHDAFISDFAAHRAIMEWTRKHGLDPTEILAPGPIHRDVEHCRIVYVGRVEGTIEDNKVWTTRVQQGETPPMPWPPELDRYRVP